MIASLELSTIAASRSRASATVLHEVAHFCARPADVDRPVPSQAAWCRSVALARLLDLLMAKDPEGGRRVSQGASFSPLGSPLMLHRCLLSPPRCFCEPQTGPRASPSRLLTLAQVTDALAVGVDLVERLVRERALRAMRIGS